MPYASYLNYNALGQVGQIDFGNGISTLYQYHTDNNRLFSITTNGASGLINLSYLYDSVGNITGITDHLDSTKSRSYIYDDIDRLIEADSPSYGGNLLYSLGGREIDGYKTWLSNNENKSPLYSGKNS